MTPRSAHFFESITKEYIYDVMGQSVYIYPFVSKKSSPSNKYEKIYGENSSLQYDEAIEIPCKVSLSPKNTNTFEETYQETYSDIEVFILRETLKDLDFTPNIGDIIVFQRLYYEVFEIDDTPMYFGSPEFKFAFNLRGHTKRVDNLDLPMIEDNDV